MQIYNINNTREILRAEQERLKKIREAQKITSSQKNLSNDSEQEKEKRRGYPAFKDVFEQELKRVKKLEE